jgi:hypothetical protein
VIVANRPVDRDYYRERAREERALAKECDEPTAALVHLKLAIEYERRAEPALEMA